MKNCPVIMSSSDEHQLKIRAIADLISTLGSSKEFLFEQPGNREMIRNNSSRIHIFCILVVITLCAGCITSYSDLTTSAKDHVDLSGPTADKAQLRAAKWDIGIAGVYCYMTDPTYAERVTVNAGKVDVSVVCVTADVGSNNSRTDKASFSFDALAGHDYVITKRDCHACVKLKDETTKKLVAKFNLSTWRTRKITPVNPNAALIRAGGASRDKGDCMPTEGGLSGQRDFIEVDAGPINFDAICETGTFSRRLRISSFNFVAEAAHTYTITAPDKECMNLLDITSKEIVIACEPYRKIK